MAWAKSGGFGGAAILHLTMTRLVPSSRLIITILIVTNLSIHSTLQNIELQNNFCVTLAGGARRSDRLSSIGLTGLPWSSQKMYGGPSAVQGRTVRNERISAHRTVRYPLADCPLHIVPTQLGFKWFCVFFLTAGGPSASHDRTVRITHLNCPTVSPIWPTTLPQYFASPIKCYDPNFLYKGP